MKRKTKTIKTRKTRVTIISVAGQPDRVVIHAQPNMVLEMHAGAKWRLQAPPALPAPTTKELLAKMQEMGVL